MRTKNLREVRERNGLIEAAGQIRSALAGTVEINAVILFGSRARDEFLEESDVDIALLSKDFDPEEPMIRRLEKVEPALSLFLGLDPVCLCPAEMETMNHLLVLDVLHDGIALLDDGTFARLRELFQQSLNTGRIVPFEGGWQINADK